MSWTALPASRRWKPLAGSVQITTAKFAPATQEPEVLSLARRASPCRSWTRMKRQCWELIPLWVSLPASRTDSLIGFGTGLSENSLTSSLVLTAFAAFISVAHVQVRPVLKDRFDAVHDVVVQRGNVAQGPHVLLYLCGLRGPGDHGADVVVPACPGEGELSHGAADFLRDRLKRLDFRHVGGSQDVLFEPLVSAESGPGTCRDAGVVLACEETGGERAPGGRSQPNLTVEGEVLLLDPLAVEHVILRLFHLRGCQTELPGDAVRTHDVCGGPL